MIYPIIDERCVLDLIERLKINQCIVQQGGLVATNLVEMEEAEEGVVKL